MWYLRQQLVSEDVDHEGGQPEAVGLPVPWGEEAGSAVVPRACSRETQVQRPLMSPDQSRVLRWTEENTAMFVTRTHSNSYYQHARRSAL